MTPLDKWLACCRDLYLTTHNTHKRQVTDIYDLSHLLTNRITINNKTRCRNFGVL